MSDTIVRPTFYEGEILSAADLVAAVESPRSQLARHERYQHRWGIATGLDIKGIPSNDAPTSVTVSAGVAVDGSGREIVVSPDVTLDPADFSSQVVAQKDIWYPVYLSGRDEQATGSSALTGACANSQPNQIKEQYDISFGTPGSDQNLAEQTASDIAYGPADGTSANPWLILLGYIQFDSGKGNFAKVADFDPQSSVRRRYVGVNAEAVVSGSGTLQLATHDASSGASPIMALELHEANKGELVFGKQGSDGNVVPVLTVSAAGDLKITGKFDSAVKPATIQVQSGSAYDGAVLPLPPGVASSANANIHVHVSLRAIDYPRPPSAAAVDTWFWTPLECWADDSRQVACRILWLKVGGTPADVFQASAICNYTVLASLGSGG